jgi:hypothetical protein
VLRLETYIADAQRENDSDLADFFKRAQDATRRGAEQGKDLLAKASVGRRYDFLLLLRPPLC